MKTPVLIPARNEEAYLPRTLSALPADYVEPLVLINGTTDGTEDIANQFGADVLKLEQPGKLPAIQAGLKLLGERAISPLIILDGDTYPVAPKLWYGGMIRNLLSGDSDKPASTGGLVWFTEGGLIEGIARTTFGCMKGLRARLSSDLVFSGLYGPNMAINLRNYSTLEQVLDMPNYWPSEDMAIADTVIRNGGSHNASVNPSMLAISPLSDSAIPILRSIRIGVAEARQQSLDLYTSRAPEGSQPYISNMHTLEPQQAKSLQLDQD